MDTPKIEFRIVSSQKNTYIQCETSHTDDDGVISNKRGFIQVVPEKAAGLLDKLQKGQRVATFGQYNRQQGLWAVNVAPAAASEENAAPAVTAPAEVELITQK